MTDRQRFIAIGIATVFTIISIGIVNLVASLETRSDTTVTRRIVAVCAVDPHGRRCQQEALPQVFGNATPKELKRYETAIKERQKALEGGVTP